MAIDFAKIHNTLKTAPAVPARLREGYYSARLIDLKVIPEVAAIEGTATTGSRGYIQLMWLVKLADGTLIHQTQRLYNYDAVYTVNKDTPEEHEFAPVSLFIDPIAAHCKELANGKTFTLEEACQYAETHDINCEFYRNDRNILIFEPRFPQAVVTTPAVATAAVIAALVPEES